MGVACKKTLRSSCRNTYLVGSFELFHQLINCSCMCCSWGNSSNVPGNNQICISKRKIVVVNMKRAVTVYNDQKNR